MPNRSPTFFLSGIARSGSTLLGSLLNQDPRFFVSPTSPLLDLFCLVEGDLQRLSKQYTFDLNAVSPRIHKAISRAFYSDSDAPYLVDKHRGWPRNIAILKQVITPNPKVICTYRPLAENIVSFLKLMDKDPNNFVDRDLIQNGIQITTTTRAKWLWQHYSSDPFYSMQHGLFHHRENIHVVHYDQLVANPTTTLYDVYNFLEVIPPREGFDFDAPIVNTCSENDAQWGMKDLHTLRPVLEKTSDDPLQVLGAELFKYFNNIDKQMPL